MSSQSWKENDAISLKIKRDGKESVVKGKVLLPYEDAQGLEATDVSKKSIKDAWLKG